LIRPVRLFRMTRTARLGSGIDQYGHRQTGSLPIAVRGRRSANDTYG
jgi:hypothetical protein